LRWQEVTDVSQPQTGQMVLVRRFNCRRRGLVTRVGRQTATVAATTPSQPDYVNRQTSSES
jgi:hypothetical protein